MTTKIQVEQAFYAAIDHAASEGQLTPCRLDARYDADDLGSEAIVELTDLCRTACPVLVQCKLLADLRPIWEKDGSVLAGEYYRRRRGVPRWLLLYDDLRSRITTGQYQPGDSLPDVQTLQAECGSRAAVHAALSHLERGGMIAFDKPLNRAVVIFRWGQCTDETMEHSVPQATIVA